jgi:hypothetical protein
MINSRVALRVVIPGSIHISVAFLLAKLFLTFDADKLWGTPPWALEGGAAKARAGRCGRKAPGWKGSFLPRENGTK